MGLQNWAEKIGRSPELGKFLVFPRTGKALFGGVPQNWAMFFDVPQNWEKKLGVPQNWDLPSK